jgi:hypothetical protein
VLKSHDYGARSGLTTVRWSDTCSIPVNSRATLGGNILEVETTSVRPSVRLSVSPNSFHGFL